MNIRFLTLLSILFCFDFMLCGQSQEYKAFKFNLDIEIEKLNQQEIDTEIQQIAAIQKSINDSILHEVKYWNSAYPAYRWHQILMEIGNDFKGHKNGGRVALMHLAIYDALVETWKQKQKVEQKAPFEIDDQLTSYGKKSEYSSFLCEWSAAAGAAHQIIAYYFPESKIKLDSLLEQFKDSRLRTAQQFPTDIENGIKIGNAIAEKYIEYAKTDGTEENWKGEVPVGKNLWQSVPSKWDPMKAKWKPLTLENQDQFRPEPPPKDWEDDMEELRRFNENHESSDIAWKWKSQPIFDRLIERKNLEYNLNSFESAYANALFHTARFDATIAAWDGKYHYWTIRPFQYDPEFQPILIDTPNFPGYPAGHTTVAGALSEILSYLFPRDQAEFRNLALECSESRFEGGVHFRTDNEVGLEVGEKVGKYVLDNF
ncbi:MAG: phosphatase PAP2 family protein [Bacteroidota bacterium]